MYANAGVLDLQPQLILDSIDSPETHVPERRDDEHWIAVVEGPLDRRAIESWVRRPSCGAVVTFAGDGEFMMTGQELATAVQYGAGVIIIVFKL